MSGEASLSGEQRHVDLSLVPSKRTIEQPIQFRRFALYYSAIWLSLAAIAVASAALSTRPAPYATARSLSAILSAAILGLSVWPLVAWLETRPRKVAAAAYVVAGFVYSYAQAFILHLVSLVWGEPMGNAQWAGPQTILAGLFLFFIIVASMRSVRTAVRLDMSRKAVAAAESLRVRAELQALRAHLDPHFLFNTLNAIAAVVETNPPQARDMLVRAGSLLRRVLDLSSADRDAATVADEWAMVSEYLAFEQVRMGDRLRVESHLSDEALDCEIPAFLLQPLVENAIRHGLFPRPGLGTLHVTARVEGDMLHLEVRDDGVGAELDAVNKASSGFGLRATRQRVQGAYRNRAARVEVDTAPGKGFRVRLVLPMDLPPLTTEAND